MNPGKTLWRGAAFAAAAAAMLAPLVAMRFTDEVSWTAGDFLLAGLVLAGLLAAVEWSLRTSRGRAYRLGVLTAGLAAVATVWVNAAVGMIGSEANPLNLLFAVVLGIALSSAVLARGRADRLARAMALTAAAQLLAGLAGLFADPRGGLLSAAFAGLWLLSALSFRSAADAGAPAPRPG